MHERRIINDVESVKCMKEDVLWQRLIEDIDNFLSETHQPSSHPVNYVQYYQCFFTI